MIYRRDQDPFARAMTERGGDRMGLKSHLFAPDVVEIDGSYYLYYGIGLSESGMALAVADSPVGPFEYVGRVRYPDSDEARRLARRQRRSRRRRHGVLRRPGRDQPARDQGQGVPVRPRAAAARRSPVPLLRTAQLLRRRTRHADKRTVLKNRDGGYATQIFTASFPASAETCCSVSRKR